MKPLGMNATINRVEKEEEGVGQLVGEVSDRN
jgi:hypothetical protein